LFVGPKRAEGRWAPNATYLSAFGSSGAIPELQKESQTWSFEQLLDSSFIPSGVGIPVPVTPTDDGTNSCVIPTKHPSDWTEITAQKHVILND